MRRSPLLSTIRSRRRVDLAVHVSHCARPSPPPPNEPPDLPVRRPRPPDPVTPVSLPVDPAPRRPPPPLAVAVAVAAPFSSMVDPATRRKERATTASLFLSLSSVSCQIRFGGHRNRWFRPPHRWIQSPGVTCDHGSPLKGDVRKLKPLPPSSSLLHSTAPLSFSTLFLSFSTLMSDLAYGLPDLERWGRVIGEQQLGHGDKAQRQRQQPSQRPWGSHRKTDIIELIDKPMVIMASDQDQLFCCWTIVQVAGDHIIPEFRVL
uniref:Uncharacterized protein n=1 Tax=Oryza rufipogon TaxID=4529 RepID=A0A0E0N3M4_ORYRU